MHQDTGPRLNIKTIFPGMGILVLKIRRSWDPLIFNMGIPIMVRQYLYIETAPRLPLYNSLLLIPMVEITVLTHWGRVTHICISKHTIIGSDNGLLPGRHQAIIWTNAGILLIGTLGTNFSETLIEIRIFSFKKMGLNVSSAKWRPFCLGLNVLMILSVFVYVYM